MWFIVGHIHEHQVQYLKQFDVDANQASEEDQFSMAEIPQANQIDGHRVIGTIQLHKV